MYCLSVVNLLGALYTGDASRSSSTVKNSMIYLKEFFDYKHDVIDLLWNKIFRHKFNRKIVSWNLHDEDLSKNMSIVDDKGTLYMMIIQTIKLILFYFQ